MVQNGTEMVLLRSAGPQGIIPNLLFWWQSKERAVQPTRQDPSKLGAFQLQMALRKKGSFLLALYRLCCSPCLPSVQLWPQIPFSPFPVVFLAFLLNVVLEHSQGIIAPYSSLDPAIFRRYEATHPMLSFGARSSVCDLFYTNLYLRVPKRLP